MNSPFVRNNWLNVLSVSASQKCSPPWRFFIFCYVTSGLMIHNTYFLSFSGRPSVKLHSVACTALSDSEQILRYSNTLSLSLRCYECGCILSQWYYEREAQLFCKKHYWARYGEHCHGCQETISKGLIMVTRLITGNIPKIRASVNSNVPYYGICWTIKRGGWGSVPSQHSKTVSCYFGCVGHKMYCFTNISL